MYAYEYAILVFPYAKLRSCELQTRSAVIHEVQTTISYDSSRNLTTGSLSVAHRRGDDNSSDQNQVCDFPLF